MVKGLKFFKTVGAVLLLLAAMSMVTAPLAGCDRTKQASAAPKAYLPSQQFDRDGNPCMNGVCPVINQGKQWLKPCK